jgi:hypothetical protein
MKELERIMPDSATTHSATMRLVPVGTGFCISFVGSNRDLPCEHCGQPWRRHSEPILYIFDQALFETSNDIGIACEHCLAVYVVGFDNCPNCGQIPMSPRA